MKKLLALLLLLPFAGLAQVGTVKTKNGLVSGTKQDGISIFEGIPFAAPPVGQLRWRAPQAAANWKGVRKCDHFSAGDVQTDPLPFMMYTEEFLTPRKPLSEDCLYLNVWTGAKSNASRLPVIVFIHGGGFVSGAASCPIYDGLAVAKKGVVYVSINYRLGAFGFLAHPGLTKEADGKSSGNYAFLDQIAALKWVNQNIAAFGGDPSRVTIMGQSAGAFSVNALVASPLAKGLFWGAIVQSGGMMNSGLNTKHLAEAEQDGLALEKKLNASSLADMRSKSADEVLTAAGGLHLGPVIDGYVLPDDVYNIFKQGKQNSVPLLMGFNTGDGFLTGKPMDPQTYKADAEKKYGDLAPRFLQLYPGNTDDEVKQSQIAVARAGFAEWQAHTWANFENERGNKNTYLYWFAHVPPYADEKQNYGAFHSSEITFALNDLDTWHRPWRPEDYKLAGEMSSYWVNFAKTGNPNGKGLPDWPAYNNGTSVIMKFDNAPQAQPGLLKANFAFWDDFKAQGGK